MTTYSAITNAEIDQDSPVTEPLMTKLRDNPIAIAEGSSGAPKIEQAALNITTAVSTGTVGGPGGTVTISRPGTVSFFPVIAQTSGVSGDMIVNIVSGGIELDSASTSYTYTVSWSYIT